MRTMKSEGESKVRNTRFWIHDGKDLNIGTALCMERMFEESCPICNHARELGMICQNCQTVCSVAKKNFTCKNFTPILEGEKNELLL